MDDAFVESESHSHGRDKDHPDFMNDQAWNNDEAGDADTCRICRGEATPEEPLFYPCKCSGSIKFVHQDCLMEWLSHSQKKHCELCKTPFRFTKLYSPNMPPKLPSHVFIRHLIIYAVKNIATWLRACLVILVWLGILPWAMRHVWAFLFWLGDGGWFVGQHVSDISSNTTSSGFGSAGFAALATGTSPAKTALSFPTNKASTGEMVTTLLSYNTSSSLSFGAWLYNAFSIAVTGNSSSDVLPTATVSYSKAPAALSVTACDPASLLSGVDFLRNLTRYPRMNHMIVKTIEGQIITVIVVVCFILVFLIREWVVQQQPGINMGAGFNAEFPAPDRQQRLAEAVAALDALENNVNNPQIMANGLPRVELENQIARPLVRLDRPEREHQEADVLVDSSIVNSEQHLFTTNELHIDSDDENENDNESNSGRPVMPTRDALSGAAEIQRRLTEDAAGSPRTLDASEFVAIWRRANGNPDEVVRILEAEGMGDSSRHWKSAMRNVQASRSTNPYEIGETVGSSGTPQEIYGESSVLTGNRAQESITTMPEERGILRSSSPSGKTKASAAKGKEKAHENFNSDDNGAEDVLSGNNTSTNVESASAKDTANNNVARLGRPRSISDGPAPRSGPSPLANNNWSFSALPEAEDEQPIAHSVSDTSQPFLLGGTPSNQQKLPISTSEASDMSSKSTRRKYTNQVELEGSDTTRNSRSHMGGMTIGTSEGSQQRGPTELEPSEHESPTHYSLSTRELPAQDQYHDEHHDNPFHPDGLLPVPIPPIGGEAPAAAPQNEGHGFVGYMTEWLWGDMVVPEEPIGRDEEHIVEDINDEAPFVPILPRQNLLGNANDADVNDQDHEVAEAARAAGIDPNDPDVIDDAEDFEGMMELVGMRGSLAALLQNALFSAVLISLTLACGVWIPYNFGRLFLLLIANPIATIKLPLRLVFSCAAVLQDLTIVAAGCAAWAIFQIILLPRYLISLTISGPDITIATFGMSSSASKSLSVAADAVERILNGILGVILHLPDSEVPAFSAVSHEALFQIKSTVSTAFGFTGSVMASLVIPPPGGFVQQYALNLATAKTIFQQLAGQAVRLIATLPGVLAKSDSWVISLNMPARSIPLDPSLSCWGGVDRFWAILSGYIAFCFIGAAYVRKGSPFSSSQTGKEWEAMIIDILHQAGGVMKVILIISIEMLVFPLYCGMLLDLALLPLFDQATISSRLIFTIYTPLTSIFVHWFAGTCYMFHFALFVSMCRKIMRSGVLYFIRDPDDPTFHPVRDVLEQNVATQLRKITFSAMVYGALVMICLGGVVWSLAFAFEGVLPIHWSSNEPVLEFPIDLLFYNFFMPLAVKFFKPADGLHEMYKWWFQKCARMLRLTWFLFDERRLDEEGHHIRKSWWDVIKGINAKVDYSGDTGYPIPEHTTANDVDFVRDGRYVRAPGSDQVRLPKGSNVFLEVTSENERTDGLLDRDEGVHGRKSELFKLVYIPPHFRSRISVFIILIWLFAAVTGVGITIVPLVFGRYIFARIIPEHVQKNDVYAFSIGTYILGSILYAAINLQKGIRYLRSSIRQCDTNTPSQVWAAAKSLTYRGIRLFYFYSAILLVLPVLFALTLEFYAIIPLHTYFFSPSSTTGPQDHTIHFVQSWTLGLLYVKLSTRLIAWYDNSRPAEALRAVTRDGWLNPNIKIATRCFIFPCVILLTCALITPVALASLAMHYKIFGPSVSEQLKILVYRYAYPFIASLWVYIWGIAKGWEMLRGWRTRIRDEVYLIGERLHNFGDVGRSKSSKANVLAGSNRMET